MFLFYDKNIKKPDKISGLAKINIFNNN